MSIEMIPFMDLLLATAPAGGAEPVASAADIESVWDFIRKGGIMMIPIGICSLVALAVFIERMISLRRKRVIPPNFLPGLKKVLSKTGNDRKKAIEYCGKRRSPVSNVFAAGIRRLGEPANDLERHIRDAGQREVLVLRKYRRVLSVVAGVAPLLGLLGTIIGMILAFQTVATDPDAMGKTEKLATGIYMAMITTAAGLSVAIPVLVGFHWITAKIERLVMEIDLMTVDFIEEFSEGGAAFNGAEAENIEPKSETPSAPDVGAADIRVATT